MTTPPDGTGEARRLEHYRVERELADRLRNAGREERRGLYAQLYDELFRRVPDHPQLTRKVDAEARASHVSGQLAVLSRYLSPRVRYLEVGAGDCALALAVAPRVREVWALDVSSGITGGLETPAHFSLVLSEGCEIPLQPASVDLAYSNQVMEHLHPEDAHTQLDGIFAALAPGGRYVCITPNRLSGPHEYTVGELARLFREVGFRDLRVLIGARGRYAPFSPVPVVGLENALLRLSRRMRRRLAHTAPLPALLEIRLVGRRPR
jgi:SAM-dependent methyltransferase